MKRIILLVVSTLAVISASAQITITNADLPVSGTIVTLTSANAFTGMQVAATGANYTWDYSQLVPTTQETDTFFSETAGNPLLSLYFSNTPFNPNRSNHSTPGTDFSLGTTLTLTNVYNYYYNSTSAYSQTGLGAEVNGIPLPITFNPRDKIYTLPLTFNLQDSTTYQYGIDLTSTLGFYYNVRKTRRNIVDGWGTVSTPFQTFACLRVKSQIVEVDSIHIDSLGFGFSTPPITTFEYKWLATGQRVPVLQINTAANGTTPTSIKYKDAPVSVPSISAAKRNLMLFPVPATDKLTLRFENFKQESLHYQIISLRGEIIQENDFRLLSADENRTIDISSLSAGTYLVKAISSDGAVEIKPFTVQ